MTKLPKKVQEAIAAYKEVAGNAGKLSVEHRSQAEETAKEIDRVQAELDSATDAALEDPSEANLEREAALQRKLIELQFVKNASEERSTRAFGRSSHRLAVLADAAINAGREAALEHFQKHFDEKLRAVEDAKYQYLKALVDLNTLKGEAYGIYETAVTETSPNRADQLARPHFTELTLFYRGGDRQLHGISENEIIKAYKYGKIANTSVADGREITN